MTYCLIDPPSGWQYGFPKRYYGDRAAIDLDTWLLANGYPADLVKEWPDGVPCRIIGPKEEAIERDCEILALQECTDEDRAAIAASRAPAEAAEFDDELRDS